MARGDFPSAKQDQYMVRFPEGMREEIKRLAAEDGRSMNAQIVEMLNFAMQNSGIDIDEILQMLAAQRKEMADLRKQIENGAAPDKPGASAEQLVDYRRALKQKDALLMALALQLFMNRSKLPPESLILADALLSGSGEVDLLTLNSEEERVLPKARYNALVSRFLGGKRDVYSEDWDWEGSQRDRPPSIPKGKKKSDAA